LGSGRGVEHHAAAEGVAHEVGAVAEELGDLAMLRLRESIDAGGDELPVDERRLTRARRAVEKAVGLLREPDDAGWGDD